MQFCGRERQEDDCVEKCVIALDLYIFPSTLKFFLPVDVIVHALRMSSANNASQLHPSKPWRADPIPAYDYHFLVETGEKYRKMDGKQMREQEEEEEYKKKCIAQLYVVAKVPYPIGREPRLLACLALLALSKTAEIP